MSTQARTKNELTNDETNSFWAAYFIVSDALTLCHDKLLCHENGTADPITHDIYRAARLKVQANLELMQNFRLRFNEGRTKVTPPDADLIRTLALGSAKVTGVVKDPARLPDVVDATTEIFTKFQTLQEI